MDAEELSWRRRRAMARAGQTRDARGARGVACASRCCLRLLGLLLSSPGLLALVVSYCLLGACLFRYLEWEEEEVEPQTAVDKYREDCIKELWHITERLNVLYEKNWTTLVNEQLHLFEISVTSLAEAEADEYGIHNGPEKHSFIQGLFYSLAVMTTIGYGKSSPKTPAKKVVVMLFAGFGVPITMICLVHLGTLLAQGFQSAYSSILPGISVEILSPLNDKIECKSHSSQKTQSIEIEDSEDDLGESSEISYLREHLKMGHRYRDTTKPTTRSNSMMLTTMNFALDDLGQNLSRASERHSLLVECEMCAVEQNSAHCTSKTAFKAVGDLSEATIQEEESRKSMKDCNNVVDSQFSVEDRYSHCDNYHQAKEWNSEPPKTPSRTPLLDKDVTQSPHCVQHTMTETKYLRNTSLSTRPLMPASTKCSSRRGHCAKYEQDTSPLAGSDRNLCSTPPPAAIPMSHASSNWAKLPFWLIFGVLGSYICVGAAIFASLGGWPFLDGAFFCFMLLSTVGFGDFVPGYSSKAWTSVQRSSASTTEFSVASTNTTLPHPWMLMSCCIYIAFGIILVASSIVVIHKRWIPYIHTLRASLCVFDNEFVDGEDQDEDIDAHEGPIREPSFNQLFQEEHR